jgi:hypothetical protein
MAKYTKYTQTMQYTETVYLVDGVEVERERNYDDHAYDADAAEPWSDEDYDDFGYEKEEN